MYNAPQNPMKDQLKNIYKRDQKYWAKRPLSRDMLLYAASDVLVLINEQLYLNMAKWVNSIPASNYYLLYLIFFNLFSVQLNQKIVFCFPNFVLNKFICWFDPMMWNCGKNNEKLTQKFKTWSKNCKRPTKISYWVIAKFDCWGEFLFALACEGVNFEMFILCLFC